MSRGEDMTNKRKPAPVATYTFKPDKITAKKPKGNGGKKKKNGRAC